MNRRSIRPGDSYRSTRAFQGELAMLTVAGVAEFKPSDVERICVDDYKVRNGALESDSDDSIVFCVDENRQWFYRGVDLGARRVYNIVGSTGLSFRTLNDFQSLLIRADPQPGSFYRHYKGNVVAVLGVASHSYPSEFPTFTCEFATARRSDKDSRAVVVKRDHDGELRFCEEYETDSLVIYACSGDIWARPLDEFLEILGDTHDPIGGTQYYRFEQIQL